MRDWFAFFLAAALFVAALALAGVGIGQKPCITVPDTPWMCTATGKKPNLFNLWEDE